MHLVDVTVYYLAMHAPTRFWLHTCTLDHPAALPNYVKAGFKAPKEEAIRREL